MNIMRSKIKNRGLRLVYYFIIEIGKVGKCNLLWELFYLLIDR